MQTRSFQVNVTNHDDDTSGLRVIQSSEGGFTLYDRLYHKASMREESDVGYLDFGSDPPAAYWVKLPNNVTGEGATGDLEEGVQGGMNAAAGGHQQRDTKHKRQPSVNGPGPATPVDEFPDTPSGPDRPSSRLGGRDTIREAGKHRLTGQINHDLGFQGHHATNPARAPPPPAQLQVLWPSDSSPVQTITSGDMAKREKQVREGRCGLSQLKPLPPPVSPDHKRQVSVVSKD